MATKKIISAEVIGFNPEYRGKGNFQGNVLVEVTFSDETTRQFEVDGEHSEQDIKEYGNASYWSEEIG